ncbi:MAG: heparan-alpha-glucosaminide N-acetyltransferase domain-containing protein [Dehalococcoidia bacterium]
MKRLEGLDALRGLAIAAMIVANLQSVALDTYHPVALRIIGSIAAPLFILLSGFMVSVTSTRHSFRYYLLNRGAWIIGVGMLVDITVWQIYPAMSCEVLYLIGVSVPVAYLASKLRSGYRIALIAAIIGLSPVLRHLFGYTYFPGEFYLAGGKVMEVQGQTGILNHWFVDGWFPLFPWLAFSLVGVEIGQWFKKTERGEFDLRLILSGLLLTQIGVLSYFFAYPETFIRSIWSEFFYPPTVQYVALALGVSILLLLLFLSMPRRGLSLFGPLRTMGRVSLGLYFTHLCLIVYPVTWISGGWWQVSLKWYAVAYFSILISMWAIAKVYDLLQPRWGDLIGKGARAVVAAAILAVPVGLLMGYFEWPKG